MDREFSKDYVHIVTPEQAVSGIRLILKGSPDVIGVDTETTGLDWRKDKLKLVQIAAVGKPVNIFDVEKIGSDGIEALGDILTSPAVKVFHNAKFDLKFLNTIGISVSGNVFDTMLAEQVIMSGSAFSGFSLKDIAAKYTGTALDKEFQKSN